MRSMKIAIIGAGPAGLTVAHELLKNQENVAITIFEKEKQVGGLSKTFSFKGNRVDIGGHRYFTKDSRVKETWIEVMSTAGEELSIVPRNSHILYKGKAFKYPLQLNYELFKTVGFIEGTAISVSYLLSQMIKTKGESLEDYYIKQFGKRLYQMFFRDYTEKVWGISAHDMLPDWGVQRVQNTSLGSIISHSVGINRRVERSLTERFYYPKHGAGELWEYMALQVKNMGGKICLETDVTHIRITDRKPCVGYKNSEGEKVEQFDGIISTMPLKEFVLKVNDCPDSIRIIANGLQYRSLIIVAVEIDKNSIEIALKKFKDDCWIYIQDTSVKAGRIQILNNWSKEMLSDSESFLLELEYFCEEGDELWRLSEKDILGIAIKELQKLQFIIKDKEVRSWMVERIPNAYPVYAGSYTRLDEIRQWINSMEGIYCIGRNGQHHYNNMDHSMQTSYRVVDYIRGKNSEKEQIWNVNMDSDYHEIKKI